MGAVPGHTLKINTATHTTASIPCQPPLAQFSLQCLFPIYHTPDFTNFSFIASLPLSECKSSKGAGIFTHPAMFPVPGTQLNLNID